MANVQTLNYFARYKRDAGFAKVYRVGEDVLVVISGKNSIYVKNLATNYIRRYVWWDRSKGYYGRVWSKFLEYLRRTHTLTDQKIYNKAFSLDIECVSATQIPEIDGSYRKWQ